MTSLPPRIVTIDRRTDFEEIIARHGPREQARFFLAGLGQDLTEAERRHECVAAARSQVSQAIPIAYRRALVDRELLDRFLFEPQDIALVLGGNGLVANAAKYLDGQVLIGINPDRSRHSALLVPHAPERTAFLIEQAARGQGLRERRTMVEVELDDGQRLRALNELFIGQGSHRSARYEIAWQSRREQHSSSGVLVSTGTGATGWAGSIRRQRKTELALPSPTEPRLAFFVREPTQGVAFGASIEEGSIGPGEALEVISRMNSGGVIFGDGVEEDALAFPWGRRALIRLAPQALELLVPEAVRGKGRPA